MAEDLGEGVTVRASGGERIVVSGLLVLPWHPRRGMVPGTAVFFDDTLFEAVSQERAGQGWQWRLLPWRDGEVIRGSFTLSRETMLALAASQRSDQERGQRLRRLHWLLPLAGLAPAHLQQRWASDLGYPVGRAMVASCLLEIVPGAIGFVQLATLRLDGWFLPPGLRWLAIVGPLLFGEGLLRLGVLLATGQPLGSVLGLPLHLLGGGPGGAPGPAGRRPVVAARDADAGTLVLASPVLRADWAEGGVLRYQGEFYQLDERRVHEGSAQYHFRRLEEPANATLALVPPPLPAPPAAEAWEGFARTVLRTVAFSFAPARHQEEWALRAATSPLLLTRASAASEALGGLINLLADLGGGGAWWLLDLLLLAEGVLRLAISFATGSPAGSLLGLPLLPLYRRWLRS